MALTNYTYTKTASQINLIQLDQEIRANSSITIALDNIQHIDSTLTVVMRDPLTTSEETELDNTVNNHVVDPLIGRENEIVVTEAHLDPFALPLYRTKRNATPSVQTVGQNTTQTIDFQMTSEQYVSGGVLIVKNGRLGDYVTAEVYDKDSVIPSAYRAALCENWPTVASYIIKEFIEVSHDKDVTQDVDAYVDKHLVDTYPLNAKITAGLYLRMTYHTADKANTRTFAVNYRLTTKL
jgi:hypothetical protein